MTHELKTLPEYFAAVQWGTKTFEVRRNDRNFAVGDLLILREWDGAVYSEEFEARIITYVLKGGQFGIESGIVVLGMRPLRLGESWEDSDIANFYLGKDTP